MMCFLEEEGLCLSLAFILTILVAIGRLGSPLKWPPRRTLILSSAAILFQFPVLFRPILCALRRLSLD